jgi:hypothetical protein
MQFIAVFNPAIFLVGYILVMPSMDAPGHDDLSEAQLAVFSF